jgi:hypothetical protein
MFAKTMDSEAQGRMDLSTGIACLSLIVSLGACIYTRRAVIVARDAISTANKPILRVWVDGGRATNPSEFIFYIENNGNGPAIVEGIKYSDGGDYNSNLFGLFSYYAGKKLLSYHDIERNYAIVNGSKEPIVIIGLANMDQTEQTRAYRDITKLSIQLEYSTISGGRFQVLLRL